MSYYDDEINDALVAIETISEESLEFSRQEERKRQGLPSISNDDILVLDKELINTCDDEAVEFFIQYKLKRVWNEVINDKRDVKDIKDLNGGKNSSRLRDLFMSEYKKVADYIPPTGYNLSSLNGLNPQGNWQFGFKDVVAGNAGSINSIALEICSQTLQLLANSKFEFDNFALYPNPNNGNFTVQLNSDSKNKISIEVFDIRGRKIMAKEYSNTGFFNQNIELDKAQSGIYMVSISDGTKKTVKKISIR